MNAIALLFAIFYVILYTYVFLYIRKLEEIGCECSNDWKRDFIYLYVCIFIPLIILRVFDLVPKIVMVIMAFMTIAFIVVVFFYIHELKKKKCECSESNTRTVLEIVNYVQIGLGSLVIIMAIFFTHTFISGTSSTPKKKVRFARKVRK